MDKYEVLTSKSFGLICRTCLMHTELFSIEDVNWEGIQLKEIILSYTSLDLDVPDRFPTTMCSGCIRQMYQTYHFLHKSKNSEWLLKKICLREQKNSQSHDESMTEDTQVESEYNQLNANRTINEDDMDEAADETLLNDDSDILQEIESIKSDITKIQADQKFQLCEDKLIAKEGTKGFSFTCNICTATFNSRQEIQDHKQAKHRKYFKFSCERCGIRFQRIQQLVAHIRVHTGEKPYNCNICGKCFTFKALLEKHSIRHIELQKSYQCIYCDTVYTSKETLRQHEMSHTTELFEPTSVPNQPIQDDPHRPSVTMVEGGYQCNVCSKVLQSEDVLNDHFRSHGPKNHVCSVCGKSYISKERLAMHINNTHNKKHMLHCGKCSDVFATHRALQLHMRSHTDRAKPFVCDICEKAFRHETNFVIHMQSHNGDNTYACNTCETGFSDFQSLKEHLVTHARL
ncbi:hypothetical protein HUJ04_003103 [Dendroctonus ponderosae]|uniref:Protein krueppel n=1 Tax=Dendroctonus ponderosae TaxID=77166 RepID=A0AAR5PT08_DENPD|nr:hypothetical protein HUJ04_003103 [Dendroctonus ponderosae]